MIIRRHNLKTTALVTVAAAPVRTAATFAG